jgi:alpha-tubulin suppressor-like RCC1 family protein
MFLLVKQVLSCYQGKSNYQQLTVSTNVIYACGYNGNGELGDGTSVAKNTLTPVTVTWGSKTPIAITTGYQTSSALMSDGTVYIFRK